MPTTGKELACRLLSTMKIPSHENVRPASMREYDVASDVHAEYHVFSQLVGEWFQNGLLEERHSCVSLRASENVSHLDCREGMGRNTSTDGKATDSLSQPSLEPMPLRSHQQSSPTVNSGTNVRVVLPPSSSDISVGQAQENLETKSAGANFPTENAIAAKERKKMLKEQGRTPKRKHRVLEDHYDDFGDDLSGLMDDHTYLMSDYIPEPPVDPDSDETSDEDLVESLAEQFFYGEHSVRPQSQSTVRAKDWATALEFLNTQKDHLLDLCAS